MMKMKSKKGVGFLVGIAYSIVALLILVALGITISDKLGNSVGGTANDSIQYGITQLGETGLLGWLPAIIALMIGMFFLAYFMGRKGKGGY